MVQCLPSVPAFAEDTAIEIALAAKASKEISLLLPVSIC